MRISLFVPCVVDMTAPDTARATVTVLERMGHEVIYDPHQTCCGQALFNAGFRSEARRLATQFLRRFAESEAIVAPGGSCLSMVKLHYGELDLPPAELSIWETLSGRMWEFTSFLVDKLKVEDVGASFPHRVSYHPSCHLLRDLDVREQPLKLLRRVERLELVQSDWVDECCGFGGVFSVKFPELSRAMADRRAESISASEPEYITGADDSCLHHLRQAFHRMGSPVQPLHIARILAGNGIADR